MQWIKIPYYPGCTLKSTSKNFEVSAIAAMMTLGVDLEEIPRWNCCGTVSPLSEDNLINHVAPLRNLVRVQDLGAEHVVVLCSMCYSVLQVTNHLAKSNQDKLDRLNAFMNEENDYKGMVEVKHLLQVIESRIGFDRVHEAAIRPLNGLKVAPYYGCLLVRPKEVAIDDQEEPRIMHRLLEALGAEVINDPMKIECCGAYNTADPQMKSAILARTRRIVDSANNRDADAIVLSCPLCEFNLDERQIDAQQIYPDLKPIPIFYFTQLMAFAFGLNSENCGFNYNAIDPTLALSKMKENS
ncbi:MAG: CoB--CoM heterodisulfide reductase iron-sulfur subunit B family protein [Candidatus Heimdallarchaeota archaeon]